MTTVQKPICSKASCSNRMRFARCASEMRWNAKDRAQPRREQVPEVDSGSVHGQIRENKPGAVMRVIPTRATRAPR